MVELKKKKNLAVTLTKHRKVCLPETTNTAERNPRRRNKWRSTPCSWIQRPAAFKMLSSLIWRTDSTHSIPATGLVENGKVSLKFTQKGKGIWRVSFGKERSRIHTTRISRLATKRKVTSAAWNWPKDRQVERRKRTESGSDALVYEQISFWRRRWDDTTGKGRHFNKWYWNKRTSIHFNSITVPDIKID